MTSAKRKKTKPVTPYWQELVGVYFHFCWLKFNDIPTFDGSAPRDLKYIVDALQKRAEKANVEWTLDNAKIRLNTFLHFAFKDKWLSENWILSNINRQKDKIFYNIRKATPGQKEQPYN